MTWSFESSEDAAPTVIVDGSKAFNQALADSVGTLAPSGRSPELSTYWIDQAIESLEGLADQGRPFLSGNATSLTLLDGFVWATSEHDLFEDSSMPAVSFAALLSEWKDHVKAIPAGDRSRPGLSPYQRNHSFTYKSIAQQLTTAVPEFEPFLIEHTKDYGEVLSHVLFGDLTRFVLREHAADRREVVHRCLRFLERAARYGDDKVVNLVAVSFVENVGPWNIELRRFISNWPSRLRELAAEQGWSGATTD